jgi:hypothetical protein
MYATPRLSAMMYLRVMGISGYRAMPKPSKSRARRYRVDFQITVAATLKL